MIVHFVIDAMTQQPDVPIEFTQIFSYLAELINAAVTCNYIKNAFSVFVNQPSDACF